MSNTGHHSHEQTVWRGRIVEDASIAAMLVHGRGDSARGISQLADVLPLDDAVIAAPQATGNTWYPYSFLAPLAMNEPGLSSGISVIGDIVDQLVERGLPSSAIVLIGFSQGACLVAEFVARNPRRYAGLAVLSGGLIGSGDRDDHQPPADKLFEYDGHLDGTPVFLGCSDIDPHIPWARVEQSAEVFKRLGASVDLQQYPGMGHTVNYDELRRVSGLIRSARDPSAHFPPGR